MKDIPASSHLKASFVGSFGALRDMVGAERLKSWGWQQFYTYIILAEGSDPAQVNAKLPAFLAQHAPGEVAQRNSRDNYGLQALIDVHLRSSDVEYDIAQKGNIQYIYAFSLVALFTLLIACFNFMNLSTARSARRAKEVGMRKAMGAQRAQLIGQFLGESLLQTGMALVIALLLTVLVLPTLNDWTGKSLPFMSMLTIPFVLSLLAAVTGWLTGGELSGVFPVGVQSASGAERSGKRRDIRGVSAPESGCGSVCGIHHADDRGRRCFLPDSVHPDQEPGFFERATGVTRRFVPKRCGRTSKPSNPNSPRIRRSWALRPVTGCRVDGLRAMELMYRAAPSSFRPICFSSMKTTFRRWA